MKRVSLKGGCTYTRINKVENSPGRACVHACGKLRVSSPVILVNENIFRN